MTLNKQKNVITWDLALFLSLYIALPAYLGIEFSASLPLITASRALQVFLGIMLLIRRRNVFFPQRRIDLKAFRFGFTNEPILRWGILIYFGLLLITDIALIPADAGEAVKAVSVLLIEGYMLLWLLTMTIDTRQKLIAALRILVLSAGAISLLAIIGVALDANFFHALKTVTREMMMNTYYRSGVLRAEAGFGHPVFFGAFCATMIPLNMYFVEHSETRGKKLLFAGNMALILTGLVFSNSRGSLVAALCLTGVIFLIRLVRKVLKKFLKTYLPICAVTMALLVLVSCTAPNGVSFLGSIVSSVAHAILPESIVQTLDSWDTAEDSDDGDEDANISFGENEGGMRSRLRQMTAIIWTLERQPIFGLGSNAHVRGLVKCQHVEGEWWTTRTFDMAITAILCQYGIVGLLGYLALYLSLFKTLISKKYRKDLLMEYLGLAFLTHVLCLVTISRQEKVDWTLFSLIVCAVNTHEAIGSDAPSEN